MAPSILEEDVEMRDDQQDLGLESLVDNKLDDFKQEVHNKLNDLHIEIIRQFTIQKHQTERMLAEFTLDDSSDDDEVGIRQDYLDEEIELEGYI